jgi:hypothetical protein
MRLMNDLNELLNEDYFSFIFDVLNELNEK